MDGNEEKILDMAQRITATEGAVEHIKESVDRVEEHTAEAVDYQRKMLSEIMKVSKNIVRLTVVQDEHEKKINGMQLHIESVGKDINALNIKTLKNRIYLACLGMGGGVVGSKATGIAAFISRIFGG